MSVKTSRYVTDGEVDPSIREMAVRLLWRSQSDPSGTSPDGTVVGPLTEEDAWLVASRFGAYDARVIDDATLGSTEYGGSVYIGDAAVFVRTCKEVWPSNRIAFEAMAISEADIAALLFYRGDVKNWPTDLRERGYDQAAIENLARNVASSVPFLGKARLAEGLIKEGLPATDAAARAAEVYARGSSLVAFEKINDRRKVIASLLRLRDPKVAEEQIERVVMSPMSLEEVKTAFAPRSPSGPRSGTPTSNASNEGGGGGMGLLLIAAAVVGGAVLFGRKKR